MTDAHRVSYYILSLGCFKNQTDSETANGLLIAAGYNPVDSPEEADILIVNTCGFIEDAKKESINAILEAADYREDPSTVFSSKKLVVAGCLTQRYKEEIKTEMPEIDLVYGVLDDDFERALSKHFDIESSHAPSGRIPLVGAPYEYIKIAEGCSNNCSYCAIPLIRGAHRSFDPDRIIEDARLALDRGAKELVLIAQDTALYKSGDVTLPALVRKISALQSDYAERSWLRLLYCHPDHVTDDILALYDEKLLVPYLEIPFQHVNERIVSQMNRKGSYEKYSALLSKVRSILPTVAIRSTFMVGFPDESEAEFNELLSFVKEAHLDRGGAFIYSPEEGTKAAPLDNISIEAKTERYNILSEALEESFRSSLKKRVGEIVEVLVEEQGEESTLIGRSFYDAPDVDGIFYLTGSKNLVNTIVTAKVTDAVEFDLVGEL